MVSLYDADLSNPAYSQSRLLPQIKTLLASGAREGVKLDYKEQVSDEWVKTAAAFANSYGGLIVFGVRGVQDAPGELIGMPIEREELRTKLASQLVSRIQPVPEFAIAVATMETGSPPKQIAVVRIEEGFNTPYVCSGRDYHRVYIRADARNAEADYLQLMHLFAKGQEIQQGAIAVERQVEAWRGVLYPRMASFNAAQPPNEVPATRSQNFYRLVAIPVISRKHRLSLREERLFEDCFARYFADDLWRADPRSVRQPWRRTPQFSLFGYFVHQTPVSSFERMWGVATDSSVAFASEAVQPPKPGGRPAFSVADFLLDCISFLQLAEGYQAAIGHSGTVYLQIELEFARETYIEKSSNLGRPAGLRLPVSNLFVSDREDLLLNGPSLARVQMPLRPLVPDRTIAIIDQLLGQLARHYDAVIHSDELTTLLRPIVNLGGV